MLFNLRMEKRAEEQRERGKITALRKQAAMTIELSLIDRTLSQEEQDRMWNSRMEAIRKLEVRRLKELTAQIDDWSPCDFEDATLL